MSFYDSLKDETNLKNKNWNHKLMDDAKAQLAEKLRASNNILVTVSRNPTVDQLASCIALTLLLNKQAKHTAAVFSGEVPSTLEFLQPEETLQKNTDSLRDFIISLDKSKADKLRYKVEDNVVRIFITPYKNSISESDLEFTQGDFNVDVVVALGVQLQEDLDEAITAHGRILHDATLASISTSADPGLGVINWHDPSASSLSELVTELAQMLGADMLDNQVATALLTGIVAETDRFSNDKTTPQTMSASAVLMAAGANQQLVVSQLEPKPEPPADKPSKGSDKASKGKKGDTSAPPDEPSIPDDGMIEIDHDDKDDNDDISDTDKPDDSDETPDSDKPAPDDNDDAPPALELPSPGEDEADSESETEEQPKDSDKPGKKKGKGRGGSRSSKLITEPPTLGGTLTANSQQEVLEQSIVPLGLPATEDSPLFSRRDDKFPSQKSSKPFDPVAAADFTPAPPAWMPPAATQIPGDNGITPSLADLEASVKTPPTSQENINEARDEISRALNDGTDTAPEPIQALNAQPLGTDLHPGFTQPGTSDQPLFTDIPLAPGPDPSQSLVPVNLPAPVDTPRVIDPHAPPPVPPPIPFQFGNPPPQQ